MSNESAPQLSLLQLTRQYIQGCEQSARGLRATLIAGRAINERLGRSAVDKQRQNQFWDVVVEIGWEQGKKDTDK